MKSWANLVPNLQLVDRLRLRLLFKPSLDHDLNQSPSPSNTNQPHNHSINHSPNLSTNLHHSSNTKSNNKHPSMPHDPPRLSHVLPINHNHNLKPQLMVELRPKLRPNTNSLDHSQHLRHQHHNTHAKL